MLLLDLPAQLTESLQGVERCEVVSIARTIADAQSSAHAAAQFEDQALAIWREIRNHLDSATGTPASLQLVISTAPGQDEPSFAQAFAATLASVRQEHPQLHAQVLLIDSTLNAEQVLHASEQAAQHDEPLLRWRDDALWQRNFEEWSPSPAAPPWRDGGVYLITGGAGGLARVFATDIAACTRNATIVLAGRSPLSDATSAWMRTLSADVHYESVDVGAADAVQTLITNIVARHGGLNGVIHAAGVLRDGVIASKDDQAWRDVLRPKVTGCVNLDTACASLTLDFMLLCSSLSGWRGNAGQADYAAANAFLDAFAAHRNAEVRAANDMATQSPSTGRCGPRVACA